MKIYYNDENDARVLYSEDDVYFALMRVHQEGIIVSLTTKTEWDTNGCCPVDWLDICPAGYSEVMSFAYRWEGPDESLHDLAVGLKNQGYIYHNGFQDFIVDIESDFWEITEEYRE